MISFGETLKQCINEQGISVNSFTKATGLNRGWLYNIFAGVKKLPEDKFHAILRDINFSAGNEALLREMYYREIYGNLAYEKISYIINFFNKPAAKAINRTVTGCFDNIPKDNTAYLIEETDFHNILCCTINSELADNTTPFIYTNVPFDSQDIDNSLYAAIAGCRKNVQLFRLVAFESKGLTTRNVQNMLFSLRYLSIRQNIWYYYTDSDVSCNIDVLYPNFLITSSRVLLFGVKGIKSLYLHNDCNVVRSFIHAAEDILAKCSPLACYPENILELKELLEPKMQTGVSSYLQFYPCWAQFVNAEFLEQIMNPVLPFRNSIIEIAERYYADMISGFPLHFFTLGGANDFLVNGRFYEAPEEIVIKLPPKLRVSMFEKLIGYMNGTADNFFLLDERKIQVPKNIEIAYCDSCVTVCLMVSEGSEGYLGECVVQLADNNIAADFRNFQDYIIRNGFLHTKEYALRGLNDLLVLCKQLEANEKAD